MSLHDKVLSDRGVLDFFAAGFDRVRGGLRARANVDDEKLERGLAQLVMTLIELLRQLMERQAVHRMTQGSLTAEEVERLGTTFMALADRMEELKEQVGFSHGDLILTLGTLGNLVGTDAS